ncbi:PD40 domain-containing protein [Aestuariimicrobium ganziense]|uniref:PD40 domain-containing protein n=1 Tax=Aestuariimicrobium ganziense TaxID=2773677 RepID=UPI0019413185|nr:PD40 domain-containing protein [Aestuariimicrobium ganziense]
MARAFRPGQRADLWIHDIETGESTLRHRSESVLFEAPNWTLDGQWLVINGDGKLWRISVDGEDEPEHIPTPGLDDLNNDHVLDPDGRHVFVSNSGDFQVHRVALPDENGEVTEQPMQVTASDGGIWHFLHGVSPDGAELAWIGLSGLDAHGQANADKVRTNIFCTTVGPVDGLDETPGLRQLTEGDAPHDGSEYSPDGEWIWFNSERNSSTPGHAQVFRMPVGGGEPEQFTFDERVNWFPHLSPDGRRIVYISFPPGTEGHPADLDVILRELLLDDRDEQGRPTHRDLTAIFGGQGTINVNSWAPDSKRFAYVAYTPADV